MSKTRARLIASASSVDLARRAGASSADAVKPGDVRRIGPWKIHVLGAKHDRLFGQVPFNRSRLETEQPQRAADWVCGEPLAYLIEVNGQRIYIDSGGTLAQLPPNESVDLAILGVALPDSRQRLRAALQRLHPRYILPSHQDNFFRPLSAGFQFGPLSDFPRVQRECKQENRGRLILLDYFRPWTLPKAQNPKFQQPNPKQNVKSQLGNGRQSQTSRSLRANISICTINPRVREAIAKNDWQRRRYSAVGPRVRLGCGQLDRSR